MAVKVKKKSPPKKDEGLFPAYQNGARQIRGFFDDMLSNLPGYNNGLRQLQDTFPAYARGAEQVGSFFTGTPARPTGTAQSQGGAGEWMGAEPDRRASAALRGQRTQRGNTPVTEQPSAMTFADYLAMAQGMLGGGGTDYSALINQLKQNAAEGDAHLKAMYDAYQGRVAGSAPGIAQTYDQTGAGIDQNGLQATGQINDAYQAARDAQTQQFAALGIGDAAGVLASQGGQAAADQAFNTSGVARAQQASGDLNTSNKGTALDYNTNFGNAVGYTGVEQRSALQQALQTKLAELESAQASDQSDSRAQSLQLAFQLAQNASLVDPNAPPDVMAELKAQSEAAKLYAQQLKNQQLQGQLSAPVGGNLAAYQKLAQQYGIDPSNLDEFLKFVQAVSSTK